MIYIIKIEIIEDIFLPSSPTQTNSIALSPTSMPSIFLSYSMVLV
jgi:hypothetical protein